MTRQISIRWNSDMGQDYGASAQALKQYSPPPALSVTARLKGDMSELALEHVGRSRQRVRHGGQRHVDGYLGRRGRRASAQTVRAKASSCDT